MNKDKSKIIKKERRHKRVRAKIFGTKETPRLSVFRSNKYIYAELINDEESKTITAASDFTETKEIKSVKGKIKKAEKVGEIIAKKAKEHKIKKVVFDRGGYKYHGRVKALAEGARGGGLEL